MCHTYSHKVCIFMFIFLICACKAFIRIELKCKLTAISSFCLVVWQFIHKIFDCKMILRQWEST